jgi:CRP-like cAMP-binding protein
MAEQGKGEEQEAVLDLHVTQSDIAHMVGGSRQSVNQILRSFEGRGYVEVRGRKLVIKSMAALARRAAM